MIYVASPYSNNREARYLEILEVMHSLLIDIEPVQPFFSPIMHCHELAQRYGMPTDHLYWLEYAGKILQSCEEVWVMQLEGWKQSMGVQAEIMSAHAMGKPLRFVEWVRDSAHPRGKYLRVSPPPANMTGRTIQLPSSDI